MDLYYAVNIITFKSRQTEIWSHWSIKVKCLIIGEKNADVCEINIIIPITIVTESRPKLIYYTNKIKIKDTLSR